MNLKSHKTPFGGSIMEKFNDVPNHAKMKISNPLDGRKSQNGNLSLINTEN